MPDRPPERRVVTVELVGQPARNPIHLDPDPGLSFDDVAHSIIDSLTDADAAVAGWEYSPGSANDRWVVIPVREIRCVRVSGYDRPDNTTGTS